MNLRALLRAICACILGGILVAGLWPFHAPRNDVNWASDGSGLLFGKHGSIVSANLLPSHAKQGDNSCSVEIWLQPNQIDRDGMILAFYWPENRVTPFSVRQYHDGGLVLENKDEGESRKAAVYAGNVFRDSKSSFITITSGQSGLVVYVDGKISRHDSSFPLSNRDLTGRLILGNTPSTAFNWSGLIKGLAIYDRELSSANVAQNFRNWTAGSLPSPNGDGMVARYLFEEGKGSIVRNQIDSATNLLIPGRFFVLNKQFLERPWDEFRWTWAYWKDIAVNIGGFMPLGFFFSAYFSQIRKAKHSAAITIALGFAISLTIEVSQAFLPTRDSGMTDLITNTFGTALGVMLFRHKFVQSLTTDNS